MELIPSALLLLRAFLFTSLATQSELPVAIDQMVIEIDLAKHRVEVSAPRVTFLTKDAGEIEQTVAELKQNLSNGPVKDAPPELGLVLQKCKLKRKGDLCSVRMRIKFLDNSKLLDLMGFTERNGNYLLYPEGGESVLDGNGFPLGSRGEGYSWPKNQTLLRMTYQFEQP